MKAPWAYIISRNFIRIALQLYYRSIEVYGKEFFPRLGRTLIIANHQTGLIDGILIVATNKLTIRTLIKNTLWENPIIGFFATRLGMIPVYRKQDLKEGEAADANRHEQTFKKVEEIFVAGESVLIFPEGKSHDISFLQKLRSGAARMLLQSEAKHDFRLGLKWLPISLDFEEKDRPGSRVLVHYHIPRPVAQYQELYLRDSEAAVQALRNEMEAYLQDITLSFETWEHRLFLERLTELWLASSPSTGRLDQHNQLLKWKRIFEKTREDNPQEWQTLQKLVFSLHKTLEKHTLKASELFKRPTRRKGLVFSKLFTRVVFWFFPVLIGSFLWWIPTKLIRLITIKGAKQSRDIISTYHLVASVVIYPAWLLILTLPLFYVASGSALFGLFLVVVSSGLSWLVVPRRLRTEIQALFNTFRFGSLEKVIDGSQLELKEIWQLSARLWNTGLRRQILIEAPSAKTPGAA